MALRTAFAIFLWLTGLSPVSLLCLILPISVMKSDIIAKFCRERNKNKLALVLARAVLESCGKSVAVTRLVMVQRVDPQHVKHVLFWFSLGLRLSPLVCFHAAQIMRRIGLSRLPPSR